MFCPMVSVFSIILLLSVVKGKNRDVRTDQGIVRGYTVDAHDVYSFYGIPYATAPTGEDRFKAALPPPTWNGIFNATENRIVCPQPNTFKYKVNITMDCLRVHVFVPDTQEKNLPVLFYTHGGGHKSGFPAMYSPLHYVKRGMIVVNFNYRVGVYGFLCLNNEFAPGNAGMKDQVAAMKWVKRNIAKFGGDPDNITIGGSSTGSMCVQLQIISPMTNGLFNRASSVSGSALADVAVDMEPLDVAEKYANQLGVTTSQDVARLEKFYRSLSDDQIHIGFKENHKQLGFTPCVETHNVSGETKFLSENPIDIFINGNYERVPYMSAFTPMDGIEYLVKYNDWKPMMESNFREFIPNSVQFQSEKQAVELTQMVKDFYFPNGDITFLGFVYFFTDVIFVFPQYASAKLHASNSATTYLYMLSYNGTVNLPSVHGLPLWGPGHVTPLLYMQDHIESFIYDHMTKEEYILRDKLLDLYYHYVKDGKPRSALVNVTWTPVSDHVEYLHIYNESKFVMEQYPLRERMQLWDRLYNYPYTTGAGVSTCLSYSALLNSILLVSLCYLML